MAIKHKIVINVSDPNGRKANVLRGADVKLPTRLLKFLFKNWQAKRFKALMKVRPKVKRVVGLTGTPSSNGLMDLFAEYKVLDMGERLGRFIGQYRNAYFKPDKRY